MIYRSRSQKIVDYKWMFKTKLDSDSQIKHYKAYLVVKRFSQIEDIDFNEIYSLLSLLEQL